MECFILHVPTISHSDCKLQAGWCKEARREGANLSEDLALQLRLQLGIVTAGVGEIQSGRMSSRWDNRKDRTELAWLMDEVSSVTEIIEWFGLEGP